MNRNLVQRLHLEIRTTWKKESSSESCSIYLYLLLSLHPWSCFQRSHCQKFQGRLSMLSSLTVTIFVIAEFQQCKILCKLSAAGIKNWWFCVLVNSEWAVGILGVECLHEQLQPVYSQSLAHSMLEWIY